MILTSAAAVAIIAPLAVVSVGVSVVHGTGVIDFRFLVVIYGSMVIQ